MNNSPPSDPIEIPSQAPRPCDLVLKGGIASGIVYPEAVRRLASQFHFVGIAGTSAGAIVASIAAAAEYRRREHGDDGGFRVLERATRELTGKGRMLDLFRPDADTAPTFDFVRRNVLERAQKPSGWEVFWALIQPMAIPLLIALAAAGGAAWGLSKQWPVISGFGFLAVLILAAVILAIWTYSLLARKGRAWRANGYGLCTGLANGNPLPENAADPGPDRTLPPLSIWLHEQIQLAAGRKPEDPPLTFAELHRAKPAKCLEPFAERPGFRSIDFRAITTSVSLARPYELPLQTDRFAFRPEELGRILPDSVMEYLLRGWDPTGAESMGSSRRSADGRMLPMPPGDQWPIVMAARMSLSFPGLLTMVPLHDKDYDAPKPDGQTEPGFRRIWFSDGGITSNFPVDRFDSVLPRWPTLGINLMYDSGNGGPRRTSGRSSRNDRVFLPHLNSNASPQILYSWEPEELPNAPTPPPQSVLGSAFGWFMAMFRSAQVWHDNAFVQMRSSRERVAEVWLTQDEGGLNLNMEETTLLQLMERGDVAAQELIERYADPSGPCARGQEVSVDSWDGYRWVRLRVTAAALSDQLESFARGFGRVQPGDRPWREYFELEKNEFPMYAPTDSERARMLGDLEDLAKLAEDWEVTVNRKNAGRFRPGPNPPAHYRSTGSLDR